MFASGLSLMFSRFQGAIGSWQAVVPRAGHLLKSIASLSFLLAFRLVRGHPTFSLLASFIFRIIYFRIYSCQYERIIIYFIIVEASFLASF